MSRTYTARCHCGAVQLELEGPPDGALYCHCSICRRSTGAPVVQVGFWPPERVAVTADPPLLAYRTSRYLERFRCAQCGAAVYNELRSKRFSSQNVMLSLVEDRDEALAPTHHIYHDDRVLDLADDLPRFAEFGRP